MPKPEFDITAHYFHRLTLTQSQLRKMFGVPDDAVKFQVGDAGPFTGADEVLNVWYYTPKP